MIDYFTYNWEKKLVALIAAMILWIFLNQSIIDTKTIPNVPVRIINMPTDKTIPGMLPNGYLGRRVTLTLSGTKNIIDELEQGDIEVQLDGSTSDSDEWIVQITKKNLISLNPSIDLQNHITHVGHSDFILKLSRLVTSKVPIIIRPPIGKAPSGYIFLDVWPTQLMQTLSGPEEEIKILKSKGLKLVFDLGEISKGELEIIKSNAKHNDEISFPVPNKWKYVPIPFLQFTKEEINDSAAKNLRIDFLKRQLIPLNRKIPIELFYPTKYSDILNPETLKIAIKPPLIEKDGIALLDLPLYIQDVSSLFVDIIRDNLQIVITVAPTNEKENLLWSLNVVGPKQLEDTYVTYLMASQASENNGVPLSKSREEILRSRFREYLQNLKLYINPTDLLKLKTQIIENKIEISESS